MTSDDRELRIALVQLSVADGRPDRNLERGLRLVGDGPDADVYLLPELWTTGYAHGCWEETADHHTPRVLAGLADVAAERGAWIGGSLITRARDGCLVNRFSLMPPDDRDSVHYDKGHLFGPMGEDDWLRPGDRRVRVGIGPWTAGMSLCYDLRFPEMYRLDAVAGADLFMVPSEWPAERCETLELLARARAAENQAYLALCNRTGASDDGTDFGGGSMLVDPEGRIVERAGGDEEVIVASAHMVRVHEARRRIPVLDRRRPGLDVENPEG